MTEKQKAALLTLLWDSMKRDPEHKDRVRTGWGTKTKQGLCACIENIITDETLQDPLEGNMRLTVECTCDNCAVCGGQKVICGACRMCTRCHQHLEGCPGCPAAAPGA